MTPEEQQTIAFLAQGIYQNIIDLTLVFTGYGVFALGMATAVHSLAVKSWTGSQIALTALLLTISFSFTLEALYYGISALIVSHYTLIMGSGQEGIQAAAKKILPLQFVPVWPTTINVLLSDLIVAWRAWILCRNRPQRAILATLMIVNICINIADCIWGDVELQIEKSSNSIIDSVSAVLILLVNIFATFLIGWETRTHLCLTAQHHGPDNKGTRTGEVIKLLVESGAVFCLIQSINTASTLLQTFITKDMTLHIILMMVNVANAR
ncbi:hypothetical protein GYMLUDRAFT_242710 [Collybiopsis luxurians FD-317 M1]|uniref:Uncharacterized protein n=1 Tax=Collybiopsis luxurians FD-317 M1 TaxID=944289 RepID=A0A0D0C379_9AGAR|nr:hypothetical protein GYMLUDRAFT_242710 [Collybiopsis luxurians FD-317 M1]